MLGPCLVNGLSENAGLPSLGYSRSHQSSEGVHGACVYLTSPGYYADRNLLEQCCSNSVGQTLRGQSSIRRQRGRMRKTAVFPALSSQSGQGKPNRGTSNVGMGSHPPRTKPSGLTLTTEEEGAAVTKCTR